ncbi:MAG: metal-dependent transcriptional regulator [Candidatus Bathyarchaeia archaeon]
MMEGNRLSRNMEDYLEATYQLLREGGRARTADIAGRLNVKPPSVTEMLQKLDDLGFVEYSRYRGAVLTPRGGTVARPVEERRETLRGLLETVGVDKTVAEEDACEMEHRIHPQTVIKLTRLTEFLQKARISSRWLEHFRHFEKTGRHPQMREGKEP